MEDQDIIIIQITHHQDKQVLILHGHLVIWEMHLQQSKLMEPYGCGDGINMDKWEIIVEQLSNHQFKYLELHGVLLNIHFHVVVLLLQQLKLMEHYGYGELVIVEDQVLINHIVQESHHQHKQVLKPHGILLIQVVLNVLQPKLMEHCGHGELLLVMETQDIMIKLIVHHQLKFLALHGLLVI